MRCNYRRLIWQHLNPLIKSALMINKKYCFNHFWVVNWIDLNCTKGLSEIWCCSNVNHIDQYCLETRKRTSKWCYDYLFLMSVFLVSRYSPITEIQMENHASQIIKIVNHAPLSYFQSHLARLIWTRSHIMLIIYL